MVNSPSRLNSRPPAPLECGGMTPLWNRETCLPVNRATPPARGGDGPVPTFLSIGQMLIRQDQAKNPAIKPNQTTTPFRVFRGYPAPISEIRDSSRWPSARTKAKTPVIVHHQGKSRLIKASAEKSPAPWSFPTAWRLASGISSPVPFATLRLRAFALKNPASMRYQGSIKAKTPAIKANRA